MLRLATVRSLKACLFRHAFFIACVVSLLSPLALAADGCRLQGDAQTVSVKKVLDGDTVVLTDGRSVRLIGINTPEIAHKGSKGRRGNPEEPLSVQAQQALQQLIAGKPVQLQLGSLAVDHYGRTLGRLFSPAGESLQAQLLRQGLGFVVIKAPDFRYRDCIVDAANDARARNLGVWREPFYKPRDTQSIGKADTGFRRIRGVVSNVEVRRKQLWIELRGNVVIRVAAKNVSRFSIWQMKSLTGQSIEVGGWLTPHSGKRTGKKGDFKPFIMQIDDPALIIAAPH